MRTLLIFLCLFSLLLPLRAQQAHSIDNTLLWEVSGNGLKQPSYLFGTFHLLGRDFLQKMPRVEEKFQKTQAVVGEMVIDSSAILTSMSAMIMFNTTLDKLLSPEDYQLVAAYLKEVSGFEITPFNNMKPMTVQVLLSTMEWAKNNPGTGNDVPMDAYFQQQAATQGRKVIGLETMEDQLQALYGQYTLERQAEMLVRYVREKDKNRTEMQSMTLCYQNQDLACLQKLLFNTENYRPEEMAVLVDKRNLKWMEKLPVLMETSPVFVAVGAGHLVGENGLVSLLRKQGYTLTPQAVK